MPQDIKDLNPEVLWRELSGLRNSLIYDYFGTDYEIVWDLVKNEIPILKNQIEVIYNSIQVNQDKLF